MYSQFDLITLMKITGFFYILNMSLLYSITLVFNLGTLEKFATIYNDKKNKIMVNLFFFNLIGVPLTPGFFIKVQLFVHIMEETNSIFLTVC